MSRNTRMLCYFLGSNVHLCNFSTFFHLCWLDVLPFPPALDQFEPGFFIATSAALNPGVLKGIDFDELSRASLTNFEELEFVSAPKVY